MDGLRPARSGERKLSPEPARLLVGIVGRLVLILVISACAISLGWTASAPVLTPISDPTQRFELPGLSVLPPRGDNWFLASLPPPEAVSAVRLVSFAKKLREEPATRPADARLIYAEVLVWDLRDPVFQAPAAFQSSADFVQWAKEQFGNPRRQGEMVTRRSRVLGVETAPDDSLGAMCVRYRRSTERSEWAPFPDSIFIVVARGLYCLHPHWPRYMIDVSYTQLYLQGEEPLSPEAEVEPFLESPMFTTTRPRLDKSDYAKCVKGTGDLNLYIDYCTRAAESGDLSNEHMASILYSRGWRYGAKGEYDRAIADLDQAIRLKPDYNQAFRDRGRVYHIKGEYDRAIADFNQAIRLRPDYARAFNELAWLLATTRDTRLRDGSRAVKLAKEAVRLNDTPAHRDTLAAAFAEAGRFDDAVAEQERAIEMTQAAGKHDKVSDFRSRLDLYRRRQPFRK